MAGEADNSALAQTIGGGLGGLLGQWRAGQGYSTGIKGLQGTTLQGARTPFFGSGMTAGISGHVTLSPERMALMRALEGRAGQAFGGTLFSGPGAGYMDAYNAQDAALGIAAPTGPDFSQYNQQLGPMAGFFGQMAQDNTLVNMGTGLLGQDYSAMRDQELATLREQAQPYEQRAQESFLSALQAKGQLGTTGGALQTEGFTNELARADLGRQLAATQTAQSQYGLDTNRGLGAIGAGSNMQFGAAGVASGALSQMAGLDQQAFGNQMQTYLQNLNRGQQRIANAGQLYGLNQDAILRNIQSGGSMFGQLQGQDSLEAGVNLGLLDAGNATYRSDLNRQAMISELEARAAQESGGFLSSIGGAIGGGIGGFMTGGWAGAATGAAKGAGWI